MFGGLSQDVDPVLPEHIQDKSPPPSYEEVIGQHQSSLKQDQNELPPLSYIDIMPRCLEVGAVDRKVPPKFEPFSAIIENANTWLRCNNGIKVWRCETVERKIDKGTIVNLDSTFIHESTYGFNVYVIGLRLWLTKKPEEKSPTQQLAVHNIIPQEKEVPIKFNTCLGGGAGIVGGVYIVGPGLGRGLLTQLTTWTTYEGLNKTLERTNEALKESPLPGKILNIETSTIKFAERYKVEPINPQSTCWYDNGAKNSKRYTQILRVFYITGPSANETILMHDMKPEMTEAGEYNKRSKFQPTSDVMNKTMKWVREQKDIRILNLETRNTRIHEYLGETEINTDCTDEMDTTFNDKRYLRFIRIFYTPSIDQPPYTNTVLTSRLFYPMRTGFRSFEGMMETMSRIEAWLKVTGLAIFDIETVNYLHHSGAYIGLFSDKSDILVPQRLGKHWVTAIRVYFPVAFNEPSTLLLPPYLDWKVNEESQCCLIS